MKVIFWYLAGAAVVMTALPPDFAAAETPLAVEVVTVEAVSVPRIFSGTGEVVARDLRSLSFASGGRVVSVLVDAGDLVHQGQEIARQDSAQQEQRVQAAKAALAKVDADAAKARDDDLRIAKLLTQGAATRAQRDDARSQLIASEGSLDKAKAELESAQKGLSDTVLRAPVEGLVTSRRIEAGLVIGAAQPAFDIAAGPTFDALFDLAEVVLTGGRAEATPVTLNPIEGDGTPVVGVVREVSPVVDAARGTVAVKVAIEGAPAGLAIGSPVRGSVAVADEARIRLPASVLVRQGGGPAVWVRDEATGMVSLRPVVIGSFETDSVTIADGLAPGERVVARGAQMLYPGRITTAIKMAAGQ